MIMRLAGLYVLLGSCCALISSAEPDEENRRHEAFSFDLKAFLNLPYELESDYKQKDAKLHALGNLIGIGDFAIIPRTEVHRPSATIPIGLTFNVCSSDLSVFSLSFSTPESFDSACDLIIQRIDYLGISNPGMLPKVCATNLEGKNYSLITIVEQCLGVTRLSVEKGLFIKADFVFRQQPLASPVNRDVVIAQINALIDTLIALVDGDNKMADDEEAYYERIKEAYSEAKNRTAAENPPASAARFGLILSEVPTQELTDKGLCIEMKKSEKVIAGKPYLIARTDGEPIPLVKIADPEKINAKVTEQEAERAVSDAIRDIQFQVTSQGKPHYFDASLRSDGQYEVSLYGSGRRVLRVLYLDRSGEVVQFGEAEVEVVDEPRKDPLVDP